MFDTFFKKKNTFLKKAESWTINKMTQDNKTFLLRFDKSLSTLVGSSNYPYLVGIATPLRTNNQGFPSTTENEQLFDMEDKIIEAMQTKGNALFAGTITGNGVKEFILYTGKPKSATTSFDRIKDQFPGYTLQLIIREDKKWELYKTYCLV